MKDESTPLRHSRDRLLRLLYDMGQGTPYFGADGREAQSAFGGAPGEFDRAFNALHSQNCIESRGCPAGTICLSDAGQREAEQLEPSSSLRPPPPGSTVIIAQNYGIVQGGSGNVQTVSLAIDQGQVEALLSRIEAELQTLKIDPVARQEAEGQVRALREGTRQKLNEAGLRAMGSVLSGILTGAGSDLGSALMTALRGHLSP